MPRAGILVQVRFLTQLRNLLSEALEMTRAATSPRNKDVSSSFKQFLKLFKLEKESTAQHLTNGSTRSDTPQKVPKSLKEFAKERENELERALLDWAEGGQAQPPASRNPQAPRQMESETKHKASKSLAKLPASVESRSRFLVKSLVTASSQESQILRLDDLCKHLLIHPHAKGMALKEKALKHVLHLREKSPNEEVQGLAREALTLLGYTDPPRGSGIRILSIDGGGTRGIMAIELVRKLEKLTGQPVHQMFDFICGVSTGAILGILFGGMQMNMDDCERLYRHMSGHVFSENALLGTSRLVWSHAYYDTSAWEKILRETYGEGGMTEVARRKNNPKIAIVSAIMNQPLLQAYMFRSYALPERSHSNYPGGCNHKSWEAIRASAAAPGYFQEYFIRGLAHQDGGLMWNNPTALAIHEAQLLWPNERLACVVSLGTGRYVPPSPKVSTTSISLKTKMLKILDSATDTEGVHCMLHDLLPPSVYYRLNPYLTEPVSMDETRPEKLQQLNVDAQLYLRKNEHKLIHAAAALTQKRTQLQGLRDWLALQAQMRT